MDIVDFRNGDQRCAYVVGTTFCFPNNYVRWCNSGDKMWTWTDDLTRAESFSTYELARRHFEGSMQKLFKGDEGARVMRVDLLLSPAENELGVPSREYSIELADGTADTIDVSKGEEWRTIKSCAEVDDHNLILSDLKVLSRRSLSRRVCYGSEKAGYVEIERVEDLVSGNVWDAEGERTPMQWAKECVWCYEEKYAKEGKEKKNGRS